MTVLFNIRWYLYLYIFMTCPDETHCLLSKYSHLCIHSTFFGNISPGRLWFTPSSYSINHQQCINNVNYYFKNAIIQPHFERPSLDHNSLNGYGTLLFKVLEKIEGDQLTAYINGNWGICSPHGDEWSTFSYWLKEMFSFSSF